MRFDSVDLAWPLWYIEENRGEGHACSRMSHYRDAEERKCKFLTVNGP